MQETQQIFKPRKLSWYEKILYDVATRGLGNYLNDQMIKGHEHYEGSREYCQAEHKKAVITLKEDNHILTWENGTEVQITKDVLVTNFNRMPARHIHKLTLYLERDNHKVSFNDTLEKYDIKTILLM
jgi:hypothetical protein